MGAAHPAHFMHLLAQQRAALVERWYSLLSTTGFTPYSEGEVYQRLDAILDQVITLLVAETCTPAQAHPLGAALVDLRYNQPEALEHTLMIFGYHLCADLPASVTSAFTPRLHTVLAGIAAGFTHQLRTAVLSEQEVFRRAVLAARQQAETALHASEARLFTVVSNAPLILLAIDQKGMITLAAGQGLATLGLLAEDLVEKPLQELVAGWPQVEKGYQHACMGESVTRNDTIGNRVYETHFTALYDPAGTIAEIIVVAIDITEQEQARTALEAERRSLAQRVAERTAELSRANAELLRANQLKDDFVANMSHELRTPLHAILVLTEALRSGVYDPLTPQQQARLQQIESSGRHLLALINDILDLAKIGADKMELDLHPTDVVLVCQTSLKLIDQAAHAKRLRVVTAFDSHVMTMLADSRRLTQILVNLLDNAVKFTPANGTIGLQVEGDDAGQTVRFTVWDTGIGIAQEDLPRLFQPFVQLDSRLARAYEGTGLGLVLVYHLAEMHGGSVTVESTPGEGSRFTVSLPWTPTARPPRVAELPQPVTLPAPVDAQSVVVLAEDHPVTVTLLSDYLRARGYQVVIARNGIEAIERTQESRPSVVVMDIQMPGLNGLEAIRRIRADATLSHIPIIAVTALAMPGDDERCREAGANEYLSKPISLQQLITTIERLLGAGRGTEN